MINTFFLDYVFTESLNWNNLFTGFRLLFFFKKKEYNLQKISSYGIKMVTSLKLQKLLCVRKYCSKMAQNVCNLSRQNHIYIQMIPEECLSDGVVQRLT